MADNEAAPTAGLPSCPSCAATLPVEAAFCPSCGTSLRAEAAGCVDKAPPDVEEHPVPRQCSRCGHITTTGAFKCFGCGKELPPVRMSNTSAPPPSDQNQSTIRKCPKCNESTSVDLAGCVHCDRAKGIPRPVSAGLTPSRFIAGGPGAIFGCLGLIAATIAAPIFLISRCSSRTEQEQSTAAASEQQDKPNEVDIVSECDMAVRASLVSEGSYDPAGRWDYTIIGNTAEVLRKFEAKNAFGATLSSAYDCKYDVRLKRIVFLQTINAIGAQTLVGATPRVKRRIH